VKKFSYEVFAKHKKKNLSTNHYFSMFEENSDAEKGTSVFLLESRIYINIYILNAHDQSSFSS